MEFFSHTQATCNVHFNNLPLPGPILIIEYAVWSKKNQCIGQSFTFKGNLQYYSMTFASTCISIPEITLT